MADQNAPQAPRVGVVGQQGQPPQQQPQQQVVIVQQPAEPQPTGQQKKYCSECGAEVTGKFCNNCGTEIK